MVGQVIASGMAPTVVNSATEETGLINQLFKIGILIGGLILIGIAVAIAVWVFSLDLGGIYDSVTSPFRSVYRVFESGFTFLGGAVSFIGSSIGFGSNAKGSNYKNRALRSSSNRFSLTRSILNSNKR